jgi:hypothetical protein
VIDGEEARRRGLGVPLAIISILILYGLVGLLFYLWFMA